MQHLMTERDLLSEYNTNANATGCHTSNIDGNGSISASSSPAIGGDTASNGSGIKATTRGIGTDTTGTDTDSNKWFY